MDLYIFYLQSIMGGILYDKTKELMIDLIKKSNFYNSWIKIDDVFIKKYEKEIINLLNKEDNFQFIIDKNWIGYKYNPFLKEIRSVKLSSFNSNILNIPETISYKNENNVEQIGEILGIGDWAFENIWNNKINEIRIPNSIKYIGKRAFCQFEKSNLKINFENNSGLEIINKESFKNIWSVNYIPHKIKIIPEWAFEWVDILEKLLNTNIEEIWKKAFKSSKLDAWYLHSILRDVKTIREEVFENCKIKNLNSNCDFVFNKIEEIKDGAFKQSNISNVFIHSPYLKSIGKEAFIECDNLKHFHISRDNAPIEEIKEYTFYDCKKLKDIYIKSKNLKIVKERSFWLYNDNTFKETGERTFYFENKDIKISKLFLGDEYTDLNYQNKDIKEDVLKKSNKYWYTYNLKDISKNLID